MQGLPPESSTTFILTAGLGRPRPFTDILFIDSASETLHKQPKATQRVTKAAEPGRGPRLSGPYRPLRTSWDWNRLVWRRLALP